MASKRELHFKILDVVQITCGVVLIVVPAVLGKQEVVWSLIGVCCVVWGVADLRKWR